MTSRPLALLVAGRTVERVRRARSSDFPEWFADGLGRSLDPKLGELVLFDPRSESPEPVVEELAGVVVTGSPDMVTEEAEWSVRGEAWLKRALDESVPILGVCYGHQMLARISGGRCDWNPKGREIGTVEIVRSAAARTDELFTASPETFRAQCSHSQSVVTLPPAAIHLASSALDPHQSFRVADRPAWGVQFHPEFDADIVRGYLEERRPDIEREGHDVDRLIEETAEGPHATELLSRFDSICRARQA